MNQNKQAKSLPSKTSFAISKNEQIRNEILSEVKIRDLQDPEQIKQALRYVFALIGLRADQIPGEAEKAVLLDYIQNNLQNYTPNEIKIAFELALKGDFEADLNHFGQFSARYLLSVFNKYLDHRNKIAKEVMNQESKKQLEQEQERLSNDPEEKKRIRKEFIQAIIIPAFEKFKETKRIDFGSVPVTFVYDQFKKEKLISFEEDPGKFFVISEKEKEKIISEAKKRTASDVNHAKNKFSIKKEEIELRKILRDAEEGPKAKEKIFKENVKILVIEGFFSYCLTQYGEKYEFE